MSRLCAAVALLAALLAAAGAAQAGLTRQEIAGAGFAQHGGAQLPNEVVLREADNTEHDLGTLLAGRPALLIFADYTCTTLCGVAVGALAEALRTVPSREEADYRVLVVGFNAADGPAQAAAFRDARVGGTEFARRTHFLSGTPEAIASLTRAVGMTVSYDAEHGQFAHPLGVLLITPAGRIARYLDPLALTSFDLRLSLAETGRVTFASAADHLALLCYGWDAVTGVYTLAVRRILGAGCGLTVMLLGAMTLFFIRRERRGADASLVRERMEAGAAEVAAPADPGGSRFGRMSGTANTGGAP